MDIDFKYKSSNTSNSAAPRDMGATARSEIDTEVGKDYQAQFERVQKELKETEQPGTSSQKVTFPLIRVPATQTQKQEKHINYSSTKFSSKMLFSPFLGILA